MGRVAVDAIRATWRDHFDRRVIHARIAHLHRAGVRAQQQRAAVVIFGVDVERILHRTRGMVLRTVQRSEVVPVVFDFGAVGHVETDGAENLFDALPSAHHGVQAAVADTASGQRDVDRFCCQPLIHQRVGQRLTTRGERFFNLLLDDVDTRAFCLARFRVEFAQTFEQLGQFAGFAKETRLLVFERRSVRGGGECSPCIRDNLFQIHEALRVSVYPCAAEAVAPTKTGLGKSPVSPHSQGEPSAAAYFATCGRCCHPLHACRINARRWPLPDSRSR